MARNSNFLNNLLLHNPYYYDVEWRDDAASAWEATIVEIGVTREATKLAGEGTPGYMTKAFPKLFPHGTGGVL